MGTPEQELEVHSGAFVGSLGFRDRINVVKQTILMSIGRLGEAAYSFGCRLISGGILTR
jgi:hypothetical protein